MIPAFSSAGSGTLVTPPVCRTEQSKGNFQVALYHATWKYAIALSLFNGNFRADLGHFVSDALGLFFRDAFFDRFGSLVNDGFGLFQTQAGEFAHDFDDVDLVGANLGQDGIKLGLLFDGCGGYSFGGNGHSRTGGSDGRGAHAPLFLQRLRQLDQFQDVQFLDFSNNGVYGHVLSPSIIQRVVRHRPVVVRRGPG